MSSRVTQAQRDQVLRIAQRICAGPTYVNGRATFNLHAIGAECNPRLGHSTVSKILKGHDGVAFHRKCTASGCCRPVLEDRFDSARGHFKTTCCMAHRTLAVVGVDALTPIEKKVIEATTGLTTKTVANFLEHREELKEIDRVSELELEAEEPTTALATVDTVNVTGFPMRLVEHEGRSWAVMSDLCGPFGKRPSDEAERNSEWLKTTAIPRSRLIRTEDMRGNPPGDFLCCLAEQAVMLVSRFSARGMPDQMRSGHGRFVSEMATALHSYSSKGIAVNPRLAAAELPAGLMYPETTMLTIMAGLETMTKVLVAAIAGQKTDPVPAPVECGGPFYNQEEVAVHFGMPKKGPGSNAIGEIARALNIFGKAGNGRFQAVTVGGHVIDRHWEYTRQSIDILDPWCRVWSRQYNECVCKGLSQEKAANAAITVTRSNIALLRDNPPQPVWNGKTYELPGSASDGSNGRS